MESAAYRIFSSGAKRKVTSQSPPGRKKQRVVAPVRHRADEEKWFVTQLQHNHQPCSTEAHRFGWPQAEKGKALVSNVANSPVFLNFELCEDQLINETNGRKEYSFLPGSRKITRVSPGPINYRHFHSHQPDAKKTPSPRSSGSSSPRGNTSPRGNISPRGNTSSHGNTSPRHTSPRSSSTHDVSDYRLCITSLGKNPSTPDHPQSAYQHSTPSRSPSPPRLSLQPFHTSPRAPPCDSHLPVQPHLSLLPAITTQFQLSMNLGTRKMEDGPFTSQIPMAKPNQSGSSENISLPSLSSLLCGTAS
eukprot:TRINITY_DN12790_c0_g1_i1.p1 TRINITY_DN12790_c0_g1~~TRINITY_DN12790_c0_g1_i1.p1  ORF type:complete len:311 (+),score=16.37 TRINITY_DN12790_c0_g1_i1:23-934(+)